jgi:acyl-coenzyme A synthetase/AMP-(fatty) acid ligase
MYSGRIDQQAKIQGFRVELGEIEHHARTYYNNERRVIAIAFQNAQNLTEIALFVEAQAENSKELITYLRSKMPSYMIPSRIVYEPSFPLNKSEKVDRNALKERLK